MQQPATCDVARVLNQHLDELSAACATHSLLTNALCLFQVVSVYPLTEATNEKKDAISAAINSIHAGSATNLSGGLFKARHCFLNPQ